MKVSDIIKDLEAYNPDEELVVAYWDKESIEQILDQGIADSKWVDVVDEHEGRAHYWVSLAYDSIVEIIMNEKNGE